LEFPELFQHGVETIMVWGATEAEHDRNLLGFLTRAREVNLIMKTLIFDFFFLLQEPLAPALGDLHHLASPS
jgi:hypothetical protein